MIKQIGKDLAVIIEKPIYLHSLNVVENSVRNSVRIAVNDSVRQSIINSVFISIQTYIDKEMK